MAAPLECAFPAVDISIKLFDGYICQVVLHPTAASESDLHRVQPDFCILVASEQHCTIICSPSPREGTFILRIEDTDQVHAIKYNYKCSRTYHATWLSWIWNTHVCTQQFYEEQLLVKSVSVEELKLHLPLPPPPPPPPRPPRPSTHTEPHQRERERERERSCSLYMSEFSELWKHQNKFITQHALNVKL